MLFFNLFPHSGLLGCKISQRKCLVFFNKFLQYGIWLLGPIHSTRIYKEMMLCKLQWQNESFLMVTNYAGNVPEMPGNMEYIPTVKQPRVFLTQ